MKFSIRYRPWLCAAGADREHLAHAYLDIERRRLVATDGFALVAFPVELSRGDQSGPVPRAAFEEAIRVAKLRGAVHAEIRLATRASVPGGKSFSRPKLKRGFPDRWPDGFARDGGREVIVYLQPRLLYAAAKALGSDFIYVKIPVDQSGVARPRAIRVCASGDDAAVGIVMPAYMPADIGADLLGRGRRGA
jgi:hypothetical protein